MRIAAAITFVVLVLLPGCTVLPAEGPKDVAGKTDGYTPTSAFLKVFVRDDGGNRSLVDFDRREWAVSEIANRIDTREVTFLAVHGQPREIMGEVLVQDVKTPGSFASLSYQNMHATAEQRQSYDLQYQQLLDRIATPTVPSPSPAIVTLP